MAFSDYPTITVFDDAAVSLILVEDGGQTSSMTAEDFTGSLSAAGLLLAANNLSDVASASTSATNLGLGAADNVTHQTLTLTNAAGAATAFLTSSGTNAAILRLTNGNGSWSTRTIAGGSFTIRDENGVSVDVVRIDRGAPANSIRVDSSGNVGIGTGTPATALDVNGTATATALNLGDEDMDTYDEGDWTPVLEGSVTAGSHTYSTQSGRYTRIGRMVQYQCEIAISSLDGTIAGNIEISGLPFSSNGGVIHYGAPHGGVTNIEGDDYLNFAIANGATRIQLFRQTYGTAGTNNAVTPTQLGTAPAVRLTGTYFV